jgi:hypothetical protein
MQRLTADRSIAQLKNVVFKVYSPILAAIEQSGLPIKKQNGLPLSGE